MTLGGALGGLQRVHLRLDRGFRLDMSGEVAASAYPFAGRSGVAAAKLLIFKIPHTVATVALFNNGIQHDPIKFHAVFGLDGTGEHLVRRTHENPPSLPDNGLISSIWEPEFLSCIFHPVKYKKQPFHTDSQR